MSNIPYRKRSHVRKIMINLVTFVLVCAILLVVGWGIHDFRNPGSNTFTNDAQVEEYIIPVNTRIAGYIKEIHFREHSPVKKGDTLVVIDDREYRIQLLQAEAVLLSAKALKIVSSNSVITVGSNLATHDADIRSLEARLSSATLNNDRYEQLLSEGAVTHQQYEQVNAEYKSLLAQKESLIQRRSTSGFSIAEARKRLEVNNAEILRATAVVEMAKLNLSYTVITAPSDGTTGRLVIQEGQLLQPGQQLLNFVREGSKWVVANYRESQIHHLRIGQEMALEIDAIPGIVFKGTITSVSAATGSRYSGVPLDNSTGNFVKVQQRIPVRIDFSDDEKKNASIKEVRAGMNVMVDVSQ